MVWPHCEGFWTKKAKNPGTCRPFQARTSPMPFDPKLLHPDEPPLDEHGELQLPDELSALCEQLTADAAHVARCFGAASDEDKSRLTVASMRSSAVWRRRLTWSALSLTAAAVSLVALISISIITVSLQQENSSQNLVLVP